MGPLIILILLFFVMYTVMIRPQQRRAREHQALISAVEVGDEVMTTAGIFGTVTSIDGDVIGIEIAPGTIMRVARAAIGRRILPDEPDDLDDLGDDSVDDQGFGESSSSDIPTIIETPDDGDVPGPREQG